VENESHRHNVPPGSESHFKVTIATTAFEGQRLVQRHQSVNRTLKEVLESIHALALHTYTPAEWQARGEAAPQSPNCLGGELKPS
jgi:BolA protein